MMRNFVMIGAALAAAGLGLSGCAGPTPHGDANVCYELTFPKGQAPRYIPLARNVAKLEDCAGKLEGIRINFLRLGGTIHEIAGAYNDQFLFLDPSGVYASTTLTGPRYMLMGRTSDGRLVRPGYMDTQPAGPSGLPKLD
jgi:hypothetical protein